MCYWLGQSISLLGDRVHIVALPFLLFHLSHDASALGTLLAINMLPQLLFLLLGGVVVDRVPKRLTMIISDVLHLVMLVWALVALHKDALSLGHLYMLAAVFGFASAFFMPASRSIIPELVVPENLGRANAARAFASELAGIMGAPLAGVLIAWGTEWQAAKVGLELALAFNLLSFGLSAMLLSKVKVRPRAINNEGSPTLTSYWQQLAEGFAYVRGSSWLWLSIVIFALVNICISGTTVVLLPLLAEQHFSGASSFGWFLSAVAGGALLSALLLNLYHPKQRRGLLAYGTTACAGMALLGIATTVSWWTILALLALLGFSLAIFGILWETLLQSHIPEQVLGRVVSIDMLGSFALLPLGFMLMGELAEKIPLPILIGSAGGMIVLLALVGLLSPIMRRLA